MFRALFTLLLLGAALSASATRIPTKQECETILQKLGTLELPSSEARLSIAQQRAKDRRISLNGKLLEFSEHPQTVTLEKAIQSYEKLPPLLKAALIRAKASLDLVDSHVATHPLMKSKADRKPRGYPEGKTFRDCRGVSSGLCSIVALNAAHDDFGSTILHEHAHTFESAIRYLLGLDEEFPISHSPDFLALHRQILWHDPYYEYPEEAFAFAVEKYFNSDEDRAYLRFRYPSLHNFVEQFFERHTLHFLTRGMEGDLELIQHILDGLPQNPELRGVVASIREDIDAINRTLVKRKLYLLPTLINSLFENFKSLTLLESRARIYAKSEHLKKHSSIFLAVTHLHGLLFSELLTHLVHRVGRMNEIRKDLRIDILLSVLDNSLEIKKRPPAQPGLQSVNELLMLIQKTMENVAQAPSVEIFYSKLLAATTPEEELRYLRFLKLTGPRTDNVVRYLLTLVLDTENSEVRRAAIEVLNEAESQSQVSLIKETLYGLGLTGAVRL